MLGSGINLIWCHFYSCLLSNWLFAEKFSNCSNSLNFEAKINCNTTRQNDLKWRKTCTGLKFDLVHFNGPQTKFIRDSLYKHPVYNSNLELHSSNLELYGSTSKKKVWIFKLLRVEENISIFLWC